MRPIRVSAKAIIVDDQRVLLIRCVDAQGDWYLLPGGGQEHGESLPEAVARECQEEIGARVQVGPLRFVRDYVGRRHEFADHDGDVHQVELMFLCTLLPGETPCLGPSPDGAQVGVAWVRLDELDRYRIYPSVLRHTLARVADPQLPAYLGDVN